MFQKPTVSLYLDIRKTLKSGLYPVKVRVTFRVGDKFVQKYYSTGHEINQSQWDKVRSGSVPHSLRKMREEALKFEARANDIVSVNPQIKPELFDALFVGKYSKQAGVGVLYNELISKFEQEERISYASNFRCSLASLQEFRGDFPLEVVDVDFLEEYERWMTTQRKEKGETIKANSLTTVGFYLRALRAVFNLAIDRKMISADLYPFGPKKYVIPKGSNFKKALDKKDKGRLEVSKTKLPQEKKAIALWMFSYYCNGMNFTDMAYLKEENVKSDVIVFVRRKTMRTVREVKPIVVPIRPEMRLVLQEYGNHSPYLFGVINDEMNAKEKYRKIQDWIKITNKYVNEVAKRLNLGKVNTYDARHTFATALLRANANVKDISDSLGHSSTAVTEAYLKGLDLEKAKKLSKLL
jgi:integrase/recombinase XerD